jgi:alpha-glucosidase (family GH31 glycosyl hydrolase)
MATRAGAINFPMYGSDTGGYSGSAPTKEVFARWLALSAHTTIMEVLLGPNRTIWNNADNNNGNAVAPFLIDIARKYTQDHHDMIPYTRSMLYHATQYGLPVMRMMPFAFPDDTTVFDMWDEYMYGDALLVAPVTTAGATTRSVYLPAGTWIDYNDKSTTRTGPLTFTASAPLDVIPRYIKAGSIIPRGDIFKSNNNWTPNWTPNLHIEYFPAQGVTSMFDYYTGAGIVPMRGTRSGNTVTLKFNNLGVDGKLEVYNIPGFTSVVRNGQVLTNGTDFQYDAAAQRLVIPYTGATALIVTLSSS